MPLASACHSKMFCSFLPSWAPFNMHEWQKAECKMTEIWSTETTFESRFFSNNTICYHMIQPILYLNLVYFNAFEITLLNMGKKEQQPPSLLLSSCVTHSGGKKGKTSPINIIQTSMSRLFCASNSLCKDSQLNNLIAISNILISWAWYLQLNIKLSQVSKCNPTTSLLSVQRYGLLAAHRGFSTKNHMCYSVTGVRPIIPCISYASMDKQVCFN